VTLELPAAIEPHVGAAYQQPAVYALELSTPSDFEARLARYYDHEPPWLSRAEAATRIIYVGASKRLLSRLEDHVDGDVRTVGLVGACEIDGLYDVWVFDDADRAFERESGIAIDLQTDHPEWFVHSR
jgi:hypothetical protein